MGDESEKKRVFDMVPTEIVYRIIELLHPSAHLNFACTCPWFLACSRKTLKAHKEACRLHRISSDLNPRGFAYLLASAVGYSNPIRAWHVRSLEIWMTRSKPEQWTPANLSPVAGRMIINPTGPIESWRSPSYQTLLEFIKKRVEDPDGVLSRWSEPGATESDYMRFDAFLKTILISHCERLLDIKFVSRWVPPNGPQDRPNIKELCGHIDRCHQTGSWSPGLLSLRYVAVEIRPSTADRGTTRYTNSMSHFKSLLKLPNISNLYFRNLEPPTRFDLTDLNPSGGCRNTSAVESLIIDGPKGITWPMAQFLLKTPRHLRALLIRDVNLVDAEQLLHCMTSPFPDEVNCTSDDSALTMLGVHPRLPQLHNTTAVPYSPLILGRHRNLKSLTIPMFECCLMDHGRNFPQALDFAEYMCGLFSPSLESIVFQEWWIDYAASYFYQGPDVSHFVHDGHQWVCSLCRDASSLIEARRSHAQAWLADNRLFLLDQIDRGIEMMIKSRRFPRLQAIYLNALEAPSQPHLRGFTPWNAPIFTRTMWATKMANIDLHMVATRSRQRLRNVAYPRIFEYFDLRTSPLYIPGSEYYRRVWSDPVSGAVGLRNDPVTCQYENPCKACARCLLVYTGATWRQIQAIDDGLNTASTSMTSVS
jgi:hypothetical protein